MSHEKPPYFYHIGTGSQSRETDRLTIEEYGIDGFTLMETAGLQAAKWISNRVSARSSGLFVCGKGNNAGDALVVARYLSIHHDHRCHILFAAGEKELSPNAEKNFGLLKRLVEEDPETDIRFYTGIDDPDFDLDDSYDYIVDGLLGTGLTTDLRAPFDAAVNLINGLNGTVFSMDIPTGLHTDKGIVMPDAVRADHTLSFGIRKLGFYLGDGPDYTGQIHQFDLSFPQHYRAYTCSLLTAESVGFLPEIRRHTQHKYSDRVVYIVAGSEGLTGAAIMSAKSSWNAGAGAVILICPKGLLDIYEHTLPEIIKSPVGKSTDKYFKKNHLKSVTGVMSEKEGVLLTGPGLGRNPETQSFVHNLLQSFNGIAIIDADALPAVEKTEKPEGSQWIITPHPGEASRLQGKPFDCDYDRIDWAARYSVTKQITTVSKGNPVFIGTKNGENYLTGYDTRIFSRAGFGDVLAGTISAYAAITEDPIRSTTRALTDGYQKAVQIQETSGRPPKPYDLL